MVTRDPEAQALGRRYGARVLIEAGTAVTPPPAASAPASWPAKVRRGMLQLPADVPLVTPADIEALLRPMARRRQ